MLRGAVERSCSEARFGALHLRTRVRVIFASTCEVYGYAHDALVSETYELRPHSPYAASKAGADRFCFAHWKTFGWDVSIVRPCKGRAGGREPAER